MGGGKYSTPSQASSFSLYGRNEPIAFKSVPLTDRHSPREYLRTVVWRDRSFTGLSVGHPADSFSL